MALVPIYYKNVLYEDWSEKEKEYSKTSKFVGKERERVNLDLTLRSLRTWTNYTRGGGRRREPILSGIATFTDVDNNLVKARFASMYPGYNYPDLATLTSTYMKRTDSYRKKFPLNIYHLIKRVRYPRTLLII